MTAELASTRQGVLHGLAIYAGLRGTERLERVRRTIDSGDLGSTMTAMWMEFVFGQIWSREVLDAKQRSLVTIGILIALRLTEVLKNHIRIGLTNGLTVREIEEVTIQAAAYAGFPAAHAASNAILEVLQHPSFAPPLRTGGHSQYSALLAAQTQSESEMFDPLDRWIAEHLKEVKMLGETMADIAEEFTTWKYRHLMATRRAIGNRATYFGTPAVSWLLPTLEEIPFPELFSARTFIGDQPPVCQPS